MDTTQSKESIIRAISILEHALDELPKDEGESARIRSLQKRIEYLETLFAEIGLDPDEPLSIAEVNEIKRAVISSKIPF